MLERAEVDAESRQINWADGKRLSIAALAPRINEEYTDVPIDLIETHVICWLEM